MTRSSAVTDLRSWTSDDASAWLRARPPRWLSPRLAVIGWGLALAVVFAVAESDSSSLCSEATPCTPGRHVLNEIAYVLLVPQLLLLAWQPAAGWLAVPATLAFAALARSHSLALHGRPAWVIGVFALGAAWLLAALSARAVGRYRQARTVRRLLAGAARRPLPAPLPRTPSLLLHAGLGAVALVAGVGMTIVGLTGQWEDESSSTHARRATGRVLAHAAPNVLAVHAEWANFWAEPYVAVQHASSYPVGSRVTMIRGDGSWRVAAEPVREAGGSFVDAGFAGLLGVGLIGRVLLCRRRRAALTKGPVPALRVRVRQDLSGRAVVYAFDDVDAVRPLLTFPAIVADVQPGAATREATSAIVDANIVRRLLLIEKEPRPRVRDAQGGVLYGVPSDGAAVAVRRSQASSYLAPRSHARAPGRRATLDPGRAAAHRRVDPTTPRVWRHTRATRAMCWIGLPLCFIAPPPLLWWAPWDGQLFIVLLFLAYIIGAQYATLRYRFVADVRGVTLVSMRGVRFIAWHDIAAADAVRNVPAQQEYVLLTPKKARPDEIKLDARSAFGPGRSAVIAAELNDMLAQRSRRPRTSYEPPTFARWPVGILVAVYFAIVVAAVSYALG